MPSNVTMVSRRYIVRKMEAQEGVSTTKAAFEQLTDSLDPALIDKWTNQEHIAMEKMWKPSKHFHCFSDSWSRPWQHNSLCTLDRYVDPMAVTQLECHLDLDQHNQKEELEDIDHCVPLQVLLW